MASALRENILAGRVAFVAGGTDGINLAIAQRFAEAGAAVAMPVRRGFWAE